MMKLYADPITVNCRKALVGLDLMGAEFERVHVDDFTGEHRGEAYRRLNPNASVPTLVDGDLVLWESNAILAYAADKVGNRAHPTQLRGNRISYHHRHVNDAARACDQRWEDYPTSDTRCADCWLATSE